MELHNFTTESLLEELLNRYDDGVIIMREEDGLFNGWKGDATMCKGLCMDMIQIVNDEGIDEGLEEGPYE